MRNCIIFTIIPQNSTIFKTIDNETTISGQRIVGALQARKIAQQQATAQLEIDIACLKKYEIACQSGSVSTEQFDSIMQKASVTAKEYTGNIQKGTGSAQAYAQSQKANNVALQSVGIGASIASKAVKLLSATMNTIAFTAIFSSISKGISWVTGQINNYIHRNEIAIEKAEELLNTFKSEIDEITSKQDKINGYADEFKELSEGVDDLGRNVSLTADEYSRYQNIVNEIVGINPSLISGYDEENNILADKNGLLETSIQLLKDEYNQKLKNLALPDNIDIAIEGAIGRYSEAKNKLRAAIDDIGNSLTSSTFGHIDENGNVSYGYVDFGLANIFEDVIGVDFDVMKQSQSDYIYENLDAILDNMDAIKERASQTKDGIQALTESQLIDLMDYFRKLRIAYNDMNKATTSANPTLQYVAMAEDSYSQLTDIQKKFIADYVNGIQVTSETTEQEKDNIRKSIISLTQELSNLDDINVNNALADLYAIPTDEQSITEFIEQFRNALEVIQAYCKKNGLEIPITIFDNEQSINDLEAQYQRAIDFAKDKFDGYDPTAFFKEHSINTQEEIDVWQEIAQGARDAAEAEKEYLSQGVNAPFTSTFEDAWADSFTSENDKVKELSDTLLDLAEKGRLTKEAFSEADSTAGDYFKSLGISADEAVLKINKLVDESSQLSSMSDQISSMAEALGTKLEDGFVSADTLSGFDVEVRGLESWDRFQEVLGSTTSSYEECQEAANALATEWINSSNFLEQLTEQNEEYYKTQLKAMGIENYEEVISYAHALNEAKEVLMQSSLELGDATYDEIEALIAEGTYSELTANMILALYDAKIAEQAVTINTAADCENLIALVGDADRTSKSIELLIQLMEIYNKLESGVYDNNTMARSGALMAATRIKAQLEVLANGETKNMEIQPTVKLGSKGKSSASKAGKETADTYLEAFEKELKQLQDMRDRNEITEKEYLDRLRVA